MMQRARHKAPPIVVDLGTAYTRVGFAGEEQPRHTIPTPTHLDHFAAPPSSTAQWRTVLSPFLRHLYFHLLLISPRDRRLCILEPTYLPTAYKRAILAVAHSLDVPAILFFPALPLPLLLSPSPHTAGLVVDIGCHESRVVAVWQGVVLMETVESVPGGMAGIGRELLRLIAADERNTAVARRLESEVDGRQLEELVAKVVYATAEDERRSSEGRDVVYDIKPLTPSYLHFSSSSFLPLQDGLSSLPSPIPTIPTSSVASLSAASSLPSVPLLSVTIPASARASAASTLFGNNPDGFSITSAILSHLRTLPLDARAAVLSNVVIAGGGSELPGIHATIYANLVSALSALPSSSIDGRVAGGLSSKLAGSVNVRELVAGVAGSTLSWVGASVMGAVLVESEEEWMGRDEMKLNVDGRPNKLSEEEETKQPSDKDAQRQAGERTRESAAVEMEDWLFPLVRAEVSGKDVTAGSSVYLSATSRSTGGQEQEDVTLPVATSTAGNEESSNIVSTGSAADASAADDDNEQY